MKEEIFKSYDIRATYPTDINERVAYEIGKSYGSYLQEFCQVKKCVTGHDNRLSSESLYENMIKGILESGCNVIDYGLITTPMHYYTRYLNHTYGIMVTASHNPKEDNGFKFSFDEYANARGQMITDFKNYTLQKKFQQGNGMREKREVKEQYLQYMKDNIQMGPRKIKVVIDPGNGVTTTIVKDCMNLFPNIETIYICDENDGSFPNHHPDPAVEENLTLLKQKVQETHADLGIAYDGDGDRIGIVDENAHYIPADLLLIIAARDLMPKVQKKIVLYDVKCTKAIEDELKKLHATPYIERTGTSFTECTTKQKKIPLGGELSGHIFFNDRGVEICSAIYDGLRFLEILSKTEEPFSHLLNGISHYLSTPEIKIPSPNDQKFQVIEKIKEYVQQKNYPCLQIDGVRVMWENGWALIRASNTGPNITLRFEAKTEEFLNQIQKEFTDLIHQENP